MVFFCYTFSYLFCNLLYIDINNVVPQTRMKANGKRLSRKHRLQLKQGLFWYRLYPKIREMVSDQNSRDDFWTNLRQMSMCSFFYSNKCGKMTILPPQTKACRFSVEQIFEKLHASCQSWEKKLVFDIIYLNLINLIIYN